MSNTIKKMMYFILQDRNNVKIYKILKIVISRTRYAIF